MRFGGCRLQRKTRVRRGHGEEVGDAWCFCIDDASAGLHLKPAASSRASRPVVSVTCSEICVGPKHHASPTSSPWPRRTRVFSLQPTNPNLIRLYVLRVHATHVEFEEPGAVRSVFDHRVHHRVAVNADKPFRTADAVAFQQCRSARTVRPESSRRRSTGRVASSVKTCERTRRIATAASRSGSAKPGAYPLSQIGQNIPIPLPLEAGRGRMPFLRPHSGAYPPDSWLTPVAVTSSGWGFLHFFMYRHLFKVQGQ